MMIKLILIALMCLCQNVYADFNTGDTFGKGIVIQANGVNQTGGGRTLNFASGTTVTTVNNAYQITASGGGGGGNIGIGTANDVTYWGSGNTLSASNNFIFDGKNVGIGTANPVSTIDVVGGAKITATPNLPLLASSLSNTNFVGAGWVYVVGKYAYLTSDNGTTTSSFNIIDVSNKKSPVLVSQTLSTVSGNNQALYGAEGFQVIGNYAYGTGYLGNSFYVMDISNPSSPSIVGTIVDSTNLHGAEDVTIIGNVAYVENTIGNNITSIDITVPTAPKEIMTLGSANITTPEWIVNVGNYLYITSNGGGDNLVVFKTLRNGTMTEVGHVNATVPSLGIAVQGKYAYLAGIGSNKIAVVDISNPTSPSLVTTFTTGSFAPWTIAPSGGSFLYATSLSTNQVQIYNITNPTSLSIVQTITDSTNLNNPDDIKVDGEYIYVTGNSSGRLTILDDLGFQVPTVNATNIKTNDLNVQNYLQANSGIFHTGLNVGPNGILSDGNIESSGSIISIGNLGVGSTTPGQALDVVGTARMTGFALTTGYINGYVMTSDASGNGTWSVSSGGGSGNVGVGTTNRIAVYVNSSTTGAYDKLFFDGTNTGIGTSSPSTLLEVGSRKFNVSSAGNVGILLGPNDPFATLGVVGNLNLGAYAGDDTCNVGGACMSGNLSIGIEGPENNTLTLGSNGGTANGSIALGLTAIAPNASIIMNGNIGIGTFAPVNKISVVGNIGIGTSQHDAYLSTAAPKGGMIMYGNLGIGTSSPSNLLEVEGGNVGIGTFITSDSNGPNAIAISGSDSTEILSVRDNEGGHEFGIYMQDSQIPAVENGTVENDALGFFTNNSNSRFTIWPSGGFSGGSYAGSINGSNTPVNTFSIAGNIGINTWLPGGALIVKTGNVGIGTNLPGALLDINGNLRLSTGGFLVSQQQTPPTVASNACGTTTQGIVVANSTDLSGVITVGTLAVTSCGVTFNKTHNTFPNCICQDDSNVLAVRCIASNTILTITSLSSMSSDNITWFCPTNAP